MAFSHFFYLNSYSLPPALLRPRGIEAPGRLFLSGILFLLLVLPGCTEPSFERADKRLLESQFHLPKQIKYLSFVSHPRTPGWFGREGLRIRAEVEFTDSQFREYVANLENREVWRPVAYRSYSPSIGESYSDAALRWSDLPLPEATKARFPPRCAFRPELLDATHGKYYCSVITFLRVAPTDTAGRHKYDWRAAGYRYVGRACRELEEPDNRVITALAILDYEKQVMSIVVQFTG